MGTTIIAIIAVLSSATVFAVGYAIYDSVSKSSRTRMLGSDTLVGKVIQAVGRDVSLDEEPEARAEKDGTDPAVASLQRGITRLVKKVSAFPFISSLLLTPNNVQRVERRLVWAGRPMGFAAEQWISVNIFLTAGVFVYGLYGYLTGQFGIMTMVLYVGGISMLPTFWLNSKIKERSEQFDRELPNLIDKLLLASTGDGRDMLSTLNSVTEYTHGILPDELRYTIAARRLDRTKGSREVFREMAERCGNQNVSAFCETIIDAIEVRVNVTDVFREQQNAMKEIKRANNDALINKADTYLMVSAALGVMAVIVLVAAPSFIAMMQGLSQTGG